MSSLTALLKDGALVAGLSVGSRLATNYLLAAALAALWQDELVQEFVEWFTTPDVKATDESAKTDEPIAAEELSEAEILEREMLQNFTDSESGWLSGAGGMSWTELAVTVILLPSVAVDFAYIVLLGTLFCYFEVLLERMFPARPTQVEVVYERPQGATDADREGREEQVVREWIARGRVRHSSLSWWNTFVKWVLGMTVGRLLREVLVSLTSGLVNGTEISLEEILFNWLGSFFGILPLTYLISLITISARRRLAFTAGMDLLSNLLCAIFLYFAVSWLLSTEMVREVMRQAMVADWTPLDTLTDPPHLIDEL